MTVPLTAVGLARTSLRQSCGFNQQHFEPELQFPDVTVIGRVTHDKQTEDLQQAAAHAFESATSKFE